MYVYHWQGRDDNNFDGGLIGPQGEPRLGLAVVRAHAGLRAAGGIGDPLGPISSPRPPARAAPVATVPVVLRVSGKGLRLLKRGLRVGAACFSAPTRCTGRLVVTLPKRGRKSTARDCR